MARSPYPSIKQEDEETGSGAYDEGNDPEFEGAPHMAQGGYAMSDTPMDIMAGGLTPGTSDQAAPPILPPQPKTIVQDGKEYQFSPGENGSLTAKATPPVPQNTPLPGMPPSVSSDEVEHYIMGKKNDLAKFGASDQMALQNQINERRNGLPYRDVDAGKGFADALMQGVARAGNPNFQGQFEAQQNEMGNQQLQTMRGANEANLKQTEAGMSLDKMDANSVLSKQSQQTYAPLFQKLGYQPSAITKMSAANIENALGLMAEYGGKEVEAKIKQYEFGIENKKLDAMQANLQSEIENRGQQRSMEETKMKNEARKDYANMPWYSHITNRTALKSAEQTAELGDYTHDVMAYADKHGITPDQALKVKKVRGG